MSDDAAEPARTSDDTAGPAEPARPAPIEGDTEPARQAPIEGDTEPARTELYDLRVVVERIEGRSVCGMKVGDHIDLVESSRLCLPDGGHFCLYALQAVLPLLPAKQRRLPEGDWLERDDLVACPDPDERLIMRIERRGIRSLPTEDLT